MQKTTAVNSTAAPLFFAGTIQNIVARRKGSGDGRAVLLVAHYDSVSTGPGANDDAAGVATLLETARALGASGQQLKNDIIFLFTDSEETGLLGARAFVAEHPWAKEVEVALNFEARGNGGPVIMFETSPQNGALIRALAQATSYPLANSLSYEIYKRLPNSTDLTVFKARLPGMNFAYINGLTHYHTQLDNLENVDARTLQHHGSYALALSRYFGAAVPAVQPEGDAIYFDALGFLLVRYPAWLAWPLAVGVLLLFGAVLSLGFRRNELMGAGIAKGALLFSVSLIAVAAAVWGAWWIARQIHPGYSLIAQGDSYSHGLYVLGFAALALAIAAAILGSSGRRISGANLFAGALVWWAALMVAATVWVIGGSYLFTWPLFFALLGLGFAFVKHDTANRPAGKIVVTSLCAIPGILLVAPFLHLTLIAMPFALAPGLILLLGLLAGLLVPLLRSSTASNRWVFPGIVAALALVFFVLAGIGPGFDKNHRQSNHVLYLADPAKQRALWISFDARADEWTEQFFGRRPESAPLADPFPVGRRRYLQAPAPVVAVKPPEAQVLEDGAVNGLRRLRLRLGSPRGAERISVQISAEVVSAAVDGKPFALNPAGSEPAKSWSLYYFALPKEGIELVLETRSTGPLAVRVVDESYGLPLLDARDLQGAARAYDAGALFPQRLHPREPGFFLLNRNLEPARPRAGGARLATQTVPRPREQAVSSQSASQSEPVTTAPAISLRGPPPGPSCIGGALCRADHEGSSFRAGNGRR
jgi:hypothetical protein